MLLWDELFDSANAAFLTEDGAPSTTSILSLYPPYATNELKRISPEGYGYNMVYGL